MVFCHPIKDSLFMHLWIKFYIFFRCVLVGSDAYGNRYYEEKKPSRLRNPRRFVLYKGNPEASLVPAEWHGWLHYGMKVSKASTKHTPNLTGTTLAHDPKKHHLLDDGTHKQPSYTAWAP
jgi:NADH:ubiquinone oxidoreductase subunit